jgi:hypothetical protein
LTITELLITIAAVWYLAYVLTSTDGPAGIFWTLRENMPHGRRVIKVKDESGQEKDKRFHGLLDCPVCLSLWIALIITYTFTHDIMILESLACAGAAMLLHGATNWRFAQ